MIRLICLLGGYIFGLFETGVLYSKIKGVNIREHGSGNTGTTNTLRVLGLKAGVIVLIGDILKCMIPILIVKLTLADKYPDLLPLLVYYTGAGAILGHNFPFYMKFKGGKGIATTAGLILSLPWPFYAVEIVVFFGTFFATHYVSLGSLFVYIVFIVETIVFSQMGMGMFANIAAPVLYEIYAITVFLAIMAFVKHKSNIKRLLKHEESKVYLTKKGKLEK